MDRSENRYVPGKRSRRGAGHRLGTGGQLFGIIRKMDPFFRIYYIVIIVLFLVQLPFADSQSFSSWPFGGTGDAVCEINDHKDAEMLVTVEENHLSGAAVYGFLNELNLLFTNEKLIMTVTEADTGELLTESVFNVADQPQSAADDNGMYFAFKDEIPKGTHVRIRLHSQGFFKRGVFFELSDEALHDNVTILDGDVSEQTLCLSFKHKKHSLNLLRPLLFLLIEAALGFALMLLHRKFRFPIRSMHAGRTGTDSVRKPVPIRRIALVTAVTALCMVLLAEFAYWRAVSRVSARYDADMVCMDDYDLSSRIAVTDDTVVEQVIRTRKRNFCGIGLAVQNNSDGEEPSSQSFYVSAKEKERLKNVSDTVKYVKGSLLVQVYDNDTDELLVDREYEAGTLMDVTRVIAPGVKSTQVRDNKEKFVWLGFGRNIADSKGREYRIVIRGRDTGEYGIRLSTSGRTNTVLNRDGEIRKSSLCMITFFDVNKGISFWYLIIVAGMMIVVLGVGVLIRVRNIRIEYVFLVSAISMGFLFSLIVPPYCVPDERTHVDTIYRMSNEFLGIREIPGPNRIYKRACDVDSGIRNTMSLAPYMYCEMSEQLFEGAGWDTQLVPAYARNAIDNVTVLNYLPAAAGFTCARLLRRNLLTMIMMARWFNVIAVSWLMFIAVRKAPFGKGVFALIGLLPKMLNQNVSCSYDGMIIAAVFLFLAYVLHIFYEDNVSVGDLLLVVVCGWFLAANKGGAYLPLTAFLLLLPFVRRKNRKMWREIAGYTLLSMLLVFSFKFIVRVSGILVRSSGTAVKAEGKATLYTLSDFFTAPGSLFRVFESTAVIKGQNLLGDVVGINIAQQQVNAPWLIIFAFLILLLIAALNREDGRVWFSPRQKGYIALLTAAGVGLISVSMLLSWTTVGSETIEGLQGRYFLPYVILPFLCLQNRVIARKTTEDQGLLWFADVLLFVTFCNLIISTFSCPVIMMD